MDFEARANELLGMNEGRAVDVDLRRRVAEGLRLAAEAENGAARVAELGEAIRVLGIVVHHEREVSIDRDHPKYAAVKAAHAAVYLNPIANAAASNPIYTPPANTGTNEGAAP